MGWFEDATGIDSGIDSRDWGVGDVSLDPGQIVDDIAQGIEDFTDDIDEYILEEIFGLKVPDIDYPTLPEGVLVTKSGNTQPIPVVYGTRRVGGVRVFVGTTGTNNEFLHLVLALSEGEVDAIASVWINDIEVHGSYLDAGGNAISGDFSGLLRVKKYTGADAQTADADIVSEVTEWTSNHRLRGVAYVYLRCEWSQANRVFGSFPKVKVDVVGRKVYDPRTTTTAYSSNSALCLYDYLTNARYGRGLAAADLDEQSFKDAADYCDAQVTPFTGAGYQHDRYSCDGIVDTSRKVLDNVRSLLLGFRAWLPYVAGRWRLVLDKPETATFTFDTSNIIGALSFARSGRRGRLNRVQATYANPAEDYGSDLVVVDSSAFRTADNGLLLDRRISLPFTANVYRAEALAELQLKQSRQGLSVNFRSTLAALEVAVGEVVNVTHATPGWVDKLFRVAKIDLLGDATVAVSLIEYEATVYDLTLPTEAPTPPDTNLPNPNVVAAPTALTLSSGTSALLLGSDGSILTRVKVEWTPAADIFVDEYDVEYRVDNNINLVTGGSFDTQADIDAWSVNYDGNGQFTLDSLRAKLTLYGGNQTVCDQNFTGLIVGRSYTASIGCEAGTNTANMQLAASRPAGIPYGVQVRADTGPLSITFVAEYDSVDLQMRLYQGVDGEYCFFDDLTLYDNSVPYLPGAIAKGQAADTAFLVGVVDGDVVDVRARSVNTNGQVSGWLEVLDHTVLGKTDVPPDVSTFVVSEQASGVRQFDWTLTSPPVDLAGYKIRFGLGSGLPWGSMSDLHAGVLTASPFETGLLPADVYTFGIKAVDTSGGLSAAALTFNKTLGAPPTGGGASPPFDWSTEINGVGKPADNADVTGDNYGIGTGVLFNWNLDVIDSEDKPAGIRGVSGIADRTGVVFGDGTKTFMSLTHATEPSIAYGFPAIPIDDKQKYTVIIRHRCDTVSATGLYIRFEEYNGVLPSGKTHIGSGGEVAVVQARSSLVALVNNGAMPAATWVEDTYVYTPAAGVKFATFSLYNWADATRNYEVDSVMVVPVAKTAADIAYTGGVTIDSLKPAAAGADVTGNNVAAGIASQGALATISAVDTAQILDNAVTSLKLITNAVTETKITDNAVSANKIAANAVTADKIIANAVTTVKIAANTITAAKIAALTITGAEIAANAITAVKIAANQVTAAKIAALTITAAEIAANAITAAKISVTNLAAINADLGAVTAGSILSATYRTAASGKRIDINYTTAGEMSFWGDQGDASIQKLAHIGIQLDGGDYVIANFGNNISGNSRMAIYAKSYSNYAIQAYSSQSHGISVASGGGASAAGIFTQGLNGPSIIGFSTNGYGAWFQGPTSKAGIYLEGGLRIEEQSTAPVASDFVNQGACHIYMMNDKLIIAYKYGGGAGVMRYKSINLTLDADVTWADSSSAP